MLHFQKQTIRQCSIYCWPSNLSDVKSPSSIKGMLVSAKRAQKRIWESRVSFKEVAVPSSSSKKIKRLSNGVVTNFLVINEIRTEAALMAIAKEKKKKEK